MHTHPNKFLAYALGPYAVAQAVGSEYTGRHNQQHEHNHGSSYNENVKLFHLRRLQVVKAVATLTVLIYSYSKPSRCFLNIAPLRISLVFPDGTLPGANIFSESCSTMEDVIDTVFGYDIAGVAAVGINCTKPRYLQGLVRALDVGLRKFNLTRKPKLTIQPDGGLSYNAQTRGWELPSSTDDSEQVEKWARLVADAAAVVINDTTSPFSGIVAGGCFKIVVHHIERLRNACSARAQNLDQDLMGEGGYTLEQLMELAGLACAQTVQRLYPSHTHKQVLVAAGPGNQGGDGLVAARHLSLFGYKALLFYPKPSKNQFVQQLDKQLDHFSVQRIQAEDFEGALHQSTVVLDAIFGFSFKGDPRPPFDGPIAALKDSDRPIVSVDIPSAWDVEKGNVNGKSFTPAALLSLTAPKLGTRSFTGTHYLGGRFVPQHAGALLSPQRPPHTAMSTDDALFQPQRTRARYQLEELLAKAERSATHEAGKTTNTSTQRPRYRDFSSQLNDATIYDPEPLVFPNSTLHSQSHLGGLSVSGFDVDEDADAGDEAQARDGQRAEIDADGEGSEAGTIFSDSVATNTSPRPSTPPPLTATDNEETPLKASLSALSRPPSQRPSPAPFGRSQSVPVETEAEAEADADTHMYPQPHSHSQPASTSPHSNHSSHKTSPILANVSTPFRNRMRYNRTRPSFAPQTKPPSPPETQTRSAPTLLSSTTPKVSPPRRRSYMHNENLNHDHNRHQDDNYDYADSSSSSGSSTSLPQVDTGSLENSPAKATPPPPVRPRWSFGGRRSLRSGIREQNGANKWRDIEEPIKGEHGERVEHDEPEKSEKPEHSHQPSLIKDTANTQSSPQNHSKSFKSSFKAGANTASKSVSFVNGLGVHDDILDDSEDFINGAHDALVQLEHNAENEMKQSPRKNSESLREIKKIPRKVTEESDIMGVSAPQSATDSATDKLPDNSPDKSNSFDRYLQKHSNNNHGNSTYLSAGDLAREIPNYSIMKTPQPPGFYPMTPAHIPRNRQSTPVKGDSGAEEGADNSSAEFDVTKLEDNLDLSLARNSMLKTPQAPGFYPMTPAQVYKTSPISSNDSFDVVDEDDQVDQGSRGKEERKAAPDASLFVALSDIEEALKSTAADVERRKKERQPQTQTQNKILDVFRSDKSGEGMAKKAHTRTNDALAAYNQYTHRDTNPPSAASRRQIRRANAANVTNQRFSRVNTFNLIVLATQLIAGYLILQHVYNTLFNSFLTNYFDPLNPDIYCTHCGLSGELKRPTTWKKHYRDDVKRSERYPSDPRYVEACHRNKHPERYTPGVKVTQKENKQPHGDVAPSCKIRISPRRHWNGHKQIPGPSQLNKNHSREDNLEAPSLFPNPVDAIHNQPNSYAYPPNVAIAPPPFHCAPIPPLPPLIHTRSSTPPEETPRRASLSRMYEVLGPLKRNSAPFLQSESEDALDPLNHEKDIAREVLRRHGLEDYDIQHDWPRWSMLKLHKAHLTTVVHSLSSPDTSSRFVQFENLRENRSIGYAEVVWFSEFRYDEGNNAFSSSQSRIPDSRDLLNCYCRVYSAIELFKACLVDFLPVLDPSANPALNHFWVERH
ncbi:hypothetical protein E3P84_02026 [Wallemia ichthyophaga]|nr:hypothetical protein E3P84_02026 [Wallemia ichthyophaga]TIB41451.1 hypothetical protein E3P83_01978 [Wallemia ichthyophaga]